MPWPTSPIFVQGATTFSITDLFNGGTQHKHKGAFTLSNFARDFALSLHVLLNKNYLFSLLNVQASAKSRQCKRTLSVEATKNA